MPLTNSAIELTESSLAHLEEDRVAPSLIPSPNRATWRRPELVAVALAILAGLRILIFSAAFPLLNPIDERLHLMTIQLYARGTLPGSELPHIDASIARRLLLYWSPEYNHTQQDLAHERVTGPLYALSHEDQEKRLAESFYVSRLQQWIDRADYEAQSAPVYYLTAAAWYRLGAALGLHDWALDYWPRALNPIAYGILVWFSFCFVRVIYPQDAFLQFAVPALVAVFPQDVFYGMNRDVFSAPLTAASLLAMARSVKDVRNGPLFLILSSFLAGLSFLSNVSNVVLFGAVAITVGFCLNELRAPIGRTVSVLASCIVAAGALPGIWMLRNYVVIGDLTGGRAKAHDLGWTVKPLNQMFNHPLFSLSGLRYFVLELTRRFWRGEYVWHDVPMNSPLADRIYLISTAVFVSAFVIAFLLRQNKLSRVHKLFGVLSLFLVASSVLFLAVISLPFDFHGCAYPSRVLPYFVSGRIISGAILPFVLIYASGLTIVVNIFRRSVSPGALLTCLISFIVVVEIRIRSVVFASPYNFYALAGWHHHTILAILGITG